MPPVSSDPLVRTAPLLPAPEAWRAWLGSRLQPWEGWATTDFLDAWVALEWDWYGLPRVGQLERVLWRAATARPLALGAASGLDAALASDPVLPVIADLWSLHLGVHPQLAHADVTRRGLELVVRPTWATLAPWQESVAIAGQLIDQVLRDLPRRPSRAVLSVAHGRLTAIARCWDATWGRGWVTEDESLRWIGEQWLLSGATATPAGVEPKPFDLDAVLLQPPRRPGALEFESPTVWVHAALHHLPEEWQTLAHWVAAGRADRLAPTPLDGDVLLGWRKWRPGTGLPAAEDQA